MYLLGTPPLKKVTNVIILLVEKHLLVWMWYLNESETYFTKSSVKGGSNISGMKEDLTLSLSLLWTSKLDSEDGSGGRKNTIALWMGRKVGTTSKEGEKIYIIDQKMGRRRSWLTLGRSQ